MALIIAGAWRAPPENIEALRPHMIEMITKTRAEDGCNVFSFAEDAAEPGLVRVFEIWRDKDALRVHTKVEHLAAWRAKADELGVSDRRFVSYEIASERPI